MVAIRIQQFQGMTPAVDDKLLPDNTGTWAVNTWLFDGKLLGFREPLVVHNLLNTAARSVFRVPKDFANTFSLVDSYWLEFLSVHTTVVRSPNTQRTDQTYYWCDGLTPPMMTSHSRIVANNTAPTVGLSPPLLMGIPSPPNAPVVTPNPGFSTLLLSRSYTYTWVSSFGEEGAPAPPSPVFTEPADSTFDLVITVPSPATMANRSLTHTRVYRTITSDQGNAEFYFVAELPIATTAYHDAASNDVIVLNEQMTSQTFDPPPEDLVGMVSLPNGMVAGWRENQIWFCEPYQLHAWPFKYMIGVDYPIVGLGVIGQTLIACTNTKPYAVTGTMPDQMAQAAIPLPEPCTSQGSIVSTELGVYYCSPSGLVMISAGSGTVVTAKLLAKDDWQTLLNIRNLRAAMLLGTYYAFSTQDEGCFEKTAFENSAFEMHDFTGTRNGCFVEPRGAPTNFTLLQHEQPTYNVISDIWTGEVMIIRDEKVQQVTITHTTAEGDYFWRSKLFQMGNKQNLSAVKCFYQLPMEVLPADVGTRFKVFADGVLVEDRMLPASGQMFRLPNGYTADTYQFELSGNLRIENIQIATSPKELRQV